MISGAAFIFDAAPETAIRAVWDAAAGAGISDFMAGLDYPPHLTILTAEALDRVGARAALARMAAQVQPVPASFHGLGVFPGAESVAFLAPAPNRALLDLHAACYQALAPYARGISALDAPGAWVPHVTLGLGLRSGALAAMLELAAGLNLPRAALISGVIFGDFDPTPKGAHANATGSRLERIMFSGGLSPIVIRPVDPADAEAYNRLVDRLDHETQFMLAEPGERHLSILDQRKRIQAVLATNNQMIFVAENEDGALVGLLGAHGGLFQRNHHSVHIYVGILQDYAGQGLGARMFAAMEAWARGWGAHRLDLSVMVHNLRAQGLYRKMGFQVEGRLRGAVRLDGAYVDEYIMSKLLE